MMEIKVFLKPCRAKKYMCGCCSEFWCSYRSSWNFTRTPTAFLSSLFFMGKTGKKCDRFDNNNRLRNDLNDLQLTPRDCFARLGLSMLSRRFDGSWTIRFLEMAVKLDDSTSVFHTMSTIESMLDDFGILSWLLHEMECDEEKLKRIDLKHRTCEFFLTSYRLKLAYSHRLSCYLKVYYWEIVKDDEMCCYSMWMKSVSPLPVAVRWILNSQIAECVYTKEF